MNINLRIIFTAPFVLLVCGSLFSAPDLDALDKEAQKRFDNREYAKAVSIWMDILDHDPDNEKINQKIEAVYEIKQRKDTAVQKAKLAMRVSFKMMEDDFGRGKKRADEALANYLVAVRLEPSDSDVVMLRDDMRRLTDVVAAEEKRIRLSAEQQENNLRLRAEAQAEMKKKNYDGALKIWKNILSFVPSDLVAQDGEKDCQLAIENRLKYESIQALLANGKRLFDEKNYAPARLEFTQVLDLDKRNSQARNYLREIGEELDKINNAEQRGIQAEAFYNAGIRNIKSENFDQAVDDFESSLSLVANYKDAKEKIKSIASLRKEVEERKKRERLAGIDKTFYEGLMLYNAEDYRGAIPAFEKTLSLDPGNDQAKDYLRKANAAIIENEEEEIGRFSPYFDIVYSLILSGKELFNKGDFAASNKKWEQILNLFPKNRIAIEFSMKCDIKINPENYKRIADRIISDGLGYLKNKNTKKALSNFEMVRSIDSNYPGIDNLIARVQTDKARAAAAVTPADKQSIERRLQSAVASYQRGGADNLKKALADYKWVVEREPGNVQAALGINRIESQLRIGGGGAELAAAQNNLTPEQRQVVNQLYNRGINYYAVNNFQKAIDEWRKVLAIDPGHVKARNNIRKTVAILGKG